MDIDFDFAGEEDFGLARSFSSAPVGMITPQIDNKNHQNHYTEQQLGENVRDEGIRLDEFNFKMAPGVDQVKFQRDLKQMAPKMTDFAKGTTTLAFQFQGGVLVAVDARATQGPLISSNQVRKVIEINDFILGTMAGGAADCQFWEKYIGMLCRIYQLRNGSLCTVSMASMMLCNVMKQYRGYGLSMGCMFTGSDKNGAHLYYIDNDAARIPGNLFAVGSGGTFAYGVLDTQYRWDLTVQEAVELGKRAIASATFKDSASGGVVRVYHVTNNGDWVLIHDQLDVSDLHYEFEKTKQHRGDGREGLPINYL